MFRADLLAVPLLLIGLALGSILELGVAKARRRTAELPQTPEVNGHAASVGLKGKSDGLEADGAPLDEDEFWARGRRRKALVGLLLLVSILLRCFLLGWDGVTGFGDSREQKGALGIVEDLVLLLFWCITLVVLALAYATKDVSSHTPYLVHLTTLCFAYCVCVLARLLLPTSSVNETTASSTLVVVNRIVAWIDAAVSLLALLLIGSAPRGPRLHLKASYDGGHVELSASEGDIAAFNTANVSDVASCSVFSYLFFSWVRPVVALGASKPQLDEHDLPHLAAQFRSVNLFKVITQNIRDASRGQSGVYKAVGMAPRWFNPLLWRIIAINASGFRLQIILALVNAVLYYAPALFMQQIVYFLERKDDPSKQQSISFGYAYCAGLLLSMLLEATVAGQLWYHSNSVLCSRIRVQLDTAIYAKTLRRKDVAGLSASASSDVQEAKVALVRGRAPPPPAPPGKRKGTIVDGGVPPGDGEREPLLVPGGQEQSPDRRASSTTRRGKEAESDDGSAAAKEDSTSLATKSQVLNLFTVDTDRVADFAMWSFTLVDAPAEVLIGTIFTYRLLGPAAFVGLAASLLFLPINHYASKWYARTENAIMNARDRRVSLMNEVLNSIRMIKYMAWEEPFEAKIRRSRDEELRQLRKSYICEIIFEAIWLASPVVCILVSFLWYTKVQGEVLTPSIAFTSLAVFNELRFALTTLPETFVQALQCLISLRRIQKYFSSPEIVNDPMDPNDPPATDVVLRNATISWAGTSDDDESPAAITPLTPSRRRFRLEDITATFPAGELSLVCGSLGSGKSLLLLALLNEGELLAGQIICPRSPPDFIGYLTSEQRIDPDDWLQPTVAYVPQSAFLLNADIQNNILFGLPFDRTRYEATLEACSLSHDLDVLEDGDLTQIGEKGVILSGGQKARVSLARAMYSRAGTLLLDDVLAAVDAHTARHIYDKGLKGSLARGRTLILVSHHIQLCAPGAAYVLSLESGGVGFEGTSHDFLRSEQYRTLAGDMGDDDEPPPESPARPQPRKAPSKLTTKIFKNVAENNIPSFDSGASSQAESSSEEESESESEDDQPKGEPRRLIEDEDRAIGHVSRAVWLTYLRTNGHLIFWVIFTAAFLGEVGMEVLETYVVRLWTNRNDGATPEESATNFYLGLYTLVSLGTIFVSTSRYAVLYWGGLRASRAMFERILHSVLRAPLRWFDRQSLGRLLNRFGEDFERVDSELPDNLSDTLIYALNVLTTIVTVSAVTPVFLVAFFVLCVGYWHYARLYTQTARELRRLDSTSKSPLYALYSETISGSAVIRGFGSNARMMAMALQSIDRNVRFYYYLWSVNRWLSIRFSLLSGAVVGMTGFFVISSPSVDASLAGFALTFALSVGQEVLALVRRFTALELTMVAVERVKEYTDIQLEAPGVVEPRPPAIWPHNGDVSVEKLTVRYAPSLPDVLHSISFKVPGGRKVGICGATGCGKSTLAQSFFRFVEAWEGCIKIDGLDIKDIGLTDLRSRLTIIPQDPTILSGSIRSTLDVFDEFEDEEILESLQRVNLIPAHPPEEDGVNEVVFRNLETEVTEQGANFSQGERQLLCMARALLKRSKLLLLDEATSSIDYKSDELINKTIRAEFADSTLLVIAHRLRTIIDFDYVLVMDEGRILEYDAPAKLLANPESRFHALCRATGKSEFKALKRIAEGRPAPKRPKTRKTSSKLPRLTSPPVA